MMDVMHLLWSRVVLFMVGLLTDVRSLLSMGGMGEICLSVLRSVNITAGPSVSVFLSRSESNSKHLTYT